LPESGSLSVNKFSVDEKRHDAFGVGQQLTQVLIRKSLPLIVGQTTFVTYRSTCLEVEKILI